MRLQKVPVFAVAVVPLRNVNVSVRAFACYAVAVYALRHMVVQQSWRTGARSVLYSTVSFDSCVTAVIGTVKHHCVYVVNALLNATHLCHCCSCDR
jgi:hypothetical protein